MKNTTSVTKLFMAAFVCALFVVVATPVSAFSSFACVSYASSMTQCQQCPNGFHTHLNNKMCSGTTGQYFTDFYCAGSGPGGIYGTGDYLCGFQVTSCTSDTRCGGVDNPEAGNPFRLGPGGGFFGAGLGSISGTSCNVENSYGDAICTADAT